MKKRVYILLGLFFLAAPLFVQADPAPLPSPLEPKIVRLIHLQEMMLGEKDVGELVKIYAKTFSESEIDELIQFYSNPVFQKGRSAVKDATLALAAVEMAAPHSEEKDKEACLSSGDGVVEAIRSGIKLYHANEIANGRPGKFPAKLDSAKDGTPDSENLIFTQVLQNGFHGSHWSKKGSTYTQTCGEKIRSFTYDPKSGEFK